MGGIKDLGLVEFFDQELGSDADEMSPGEAVAAMIINGLGFTDRPLSLTPQFFLQVPVDLLLRDGLTAEQINRHKLGRVLDQLHDAGVSELFTRAAEIAATKEGVDTSAQVNDTTSFSVTGVYDQDSDEHEIRIKHGFSKDHRPDLKQVIHELVVSCDGGVPLHLQSHDGNSSDSKIFQERVKALKNSFSMDTKGVWIADSKLYAESTLEMLKGQWLLTQGS